MSPSISDGLIELDEIKSMGNGVPAQTVRKRAMINRRAAKNIMLPMSDLIFNLMLYPIPKLNYVYIFGYIIFALKTGFI